MNAHRSVRMCCSRKYPYPSHGRCFSLNPLPHPSRNSILVSYFPSKNRAFEIPLPLEISVNLPWGGMDIFWNDTMHQNTRFEGRFYVVHSTSTVPINPMNCQYSQPWGNIDLPNSQPRGDNFMSNPVGIADAPCDKPLTGV